MSYFFSWIFVHATNILRQVNSSKPKERQLNKNLKHSINYMSASADGIIIVGKLEAKIFKSDLNGNILFYPHLKVWSLSLSFIRPLIFNINCRKNVS